MWRGILSIIALLLICASLTIVVPILIIPNTFLHTLVPVLKPLHQAIACEAGETMEYEERFSVDSTEVHFRCVNAAGNERDVDHILRTPAHYALGTLCLGVLLMMAPLYVAIRQGGPEVQAAVQHSYDTLRQIPSEMASTGSATMLNASGQQQLEALEKMRKQGLINQEAYEIAKKQIYDSFSL